LEKAAKSFSNPGEGVHKTVFCIPQEMDGVRRQRGLVVRALETEPNKMAKQ